MAEIINKDYAGKKGVVISSLLVDFDDDGRATVDDEISNQLIGIPGYTVVGVEVSKMSFAAPKPAPVVAPPADGFVKGSLLDDDPVSDPVSDPPAETDVVDPTPSAGEKVTQVMSFNSQE